MIASCESCNMIFNKSTSSSSRSGANALSILIREDVAPRKRGLKWTPRMVDMLARVC